MKRAANRKRLFGFVLIELVVATLIAGIISGVLLLALSQSSRIQASIDKAIAMSERVAIVANQLEKDLAGAFVPLQAESKKEGQSQQATQTESANKTDTQKKSTEKEKDLQPDKKKEQKPLEKIFQGTNKDGMLDVLTFITNNPLTVFVGKDVGIVKPKVVRVQYTLKQDVENKNSYSLFRQESNELDLAEYKNIRPYELISGIKKLSVTFIMRTEKKTESSSAQASLAAKPTENKAQEQQKKVYEYKVQSEWTSEHPKEMSGKEVNKKEPELPRIPYSVEFKMTLWDKQYITDQEFVFVCPILVDSIEAQNKEKKQTTPKKEEQKSENPIDASKQPGQGQQQITHNKQIQTQEVIVYNEIEILNNALNSLKKMLGHS